MSFGISRPLLVLVLIASAAVAALADNLTGHVVDPQGKRVPGAQLRLSDRRTGELRTTRSTAEGDYAFEGIGAGEYLIEVEASSSALTASRQVSVQGVQTVDIELQISSAVVEVVVIASATPVNIQEVAKAIDVVDSDEIALRDELSITEAIRNLPGVRVKQLEGPGSVTTIKTRGLRAHDTAILIDGMRFRDAASIQGDASAFLEDMMTVDTDRIEFLRGSGSSLYGSNALGGVVNISSKPGGGPMHRDIRLEGGGLGLIRGTAGIGGGAGGDRFTYSTSASHLNVTKGVRNGMPYRNTSAQGSAKYAFTPDISISGKIWAANGYLASTENPAFNAAVLSNFPAAGPVRAIPLATAELEKFEKKRAYTAGNATFIPNQIDPDGRRLSSLFSGSLTFQQRISPDTSYRVAYSGNATRRTYIDGPAGPGSFEPLFPTRSQFEGRTHTLQARLDQRAGSRQLIAAGYEFERESYNGSATDRSPNPPASSIELRQRSSAVYAQDQFRFLDGRLQFTASARAQFFDLDKPAFSGAAKNPFESVQVDTRNAYTGDAAVAYLFRSSQTKLRSHAGNSFRAPSVYERFGGSFSSFSRSYTYYGDPRLRSERAIAVDGGLDQWLFRSKIQLSATVYYTNLQETVLFLNSLPAADPFGRFFGYGNGGGGIARGAEFSVQASPTARTRVQMAYTYTNSDSRTPTIGSTYFQIPGLSAHTFSATATQWFARRFNATFDLFAVSDYTLSPFGAANRQMIFDGPVKADVVVHCDLPVPGDRKVEVYGKVENVLNRRPYEDGFMGPGAWAISGLRFRW